MRTHDADGVGPSGGPGRADLYPDLLGYTTVQTVMTRLTRKHVLARSPARSTSDVEAPDVAAEVGRDDVPLAVELRAAS
jgi:hypothetical protein